MKLIKLENTDKSVLRDIKEQIVDVGIKIRQYYERKMNTIRTLIHRQCISCKNITSRKNKCLMCEYCVYYDILKEINKE